MQSTEKLERLRALYESSETSQSEWNAEFLEFQVACAEDSLKDEEARQGYELACLNCIKINDNVSFKRYYAKLKHYEGDKQNPLICAVHLMSLLTCNELAEFHTQLETLPRRLLQDSAIQFVLQVERNLMVGDYASVFKAEAPSEFGSFLQNLFITVRSDISECVEKGYDHISKEGAIELLQLNNEKELDGIIGECGWDDSNGNIIQFKESGAEKAVVNKQRMGMHLGYVDSIEAIV